MSDDTATIVQLPPPKAAPKRRKRKGEVIDWPGYTSLDWDPDRILESRKGKLVRVLVLGVTPDGDLWVGGSQADPADALWLLEQAKRCLLEE